MRPLYPHSDGEMTCDRVRSSRPVQQRKEKAAGRRGYAATRKAVTRVSGKKRRSMLPGTVFAVLGGTDHGWPA
jgi:hypothetical protein